MEVIIKETYEAISQEAAAIIKEAILAKPTLVLGLATGATPLGLYGELIRMHRQEGLDFSRVTTFNLDEYLGLPADHPQSYHHFMQENLFRHINISPENVHIPQGTAPDPVAYCGQYEKEIQRAGGIDIQVLGVGSNGHIGFNEPGSSLGSRTRIKTLTRETIEHNARSFPSAEQVPRFAITMGVATILESRKCLVLASGREKARAVAAFIEGPITSSVTASALQLHPRVTALLDEAAASKLKLRGYYRWVYENKSAAQRWRAT